MTQGEMQNVLNSHSLNISVNRKYLYQDAYDQLSAERESDIKRVVRVQMINTQGLDEAGIDGGGVFRYGERITCFYFEKNTIILLIYFGIFKSCIFY